MRQYCTHKGLIVRCGGRCHAPGPTLEAGSLVYGPPASALGSSALQPSFVHTYALPFNRAPAPGSNAVPHNPNSNPYIALGPVAFHELPVARADRDVEVDLGAGSACQTQLG